MRYTIPQEMDYEYLNDLIASDRVKLLRSFCQETISNRGFIAPTDLRSR